MAHSESWVPNALVGACYVWTSKRKNKRKQKWKYFVSFTMMTEWDCDWNAGSQEWRYAKLADVERYRTDRHQHNNMNNSKNGPISIEANTVSCNLNPLLCSLILFLRLLLIFSYIFWVPGDPKMAYNIIRCNVVSSDYYLLLCILLNNTFNQRSYMLFRLISIHCDFVCSSHS